MTDHDFSDPLSYLNAIEASWLAADSLIPRCPTCTEERRMLPMPGNGWAVDVIHESHCPEHEDNQPAAEYGPSDFR